MSTSTTSPAASPAAQTPLAAAKTPVGPGAISVVGPLLALVFLAAGVVLVRDALVWFGVVSGRAWTQQLGAGLNGLGPTAWTVTVGIVAAVLGIVLVVVGLRRRPRTGIRLDAATGVFLRPTDVARLARDAAGRVDGVLDARARATRRSVEVRVTSSGTDVRPQVEQAVRARLQAVSTAPAVRVLVTGASR